MTTIKTWQERKAEYKGDRTYLDTQSALQAEIDELRARVAELESAHPASAVDSYSHPCTLTGCNGAMICSLCDPQNFELRTNNEETE